ncbi:MAG: hypothetical protein ABR591_11905 [Candidatus Velthaea sp.]
MGPTPPSPDLVLANGTVEVGIPVSYGPRIMHYGFAGERNWLGRAPQVERATPHGLWRAYGGHRLWAAPELFPDTYTIDDAPITIERSDARCAVVVQPADAGRRVEKRLTVELAPSGSAVTVRHEVVNRAAHAIDTAAWALTVVQSGGVAIVPNAEYRPQPEALLPARTIAVWPYTRLGDPRFSFGPRFLRLRCDPAQAEPQKIGIRNERGWCAYLTDGGAFVKRASYDAAAAYPDWNCTTEIFTAGAFLELETLGPLRTIAPGERAEHIERWSLHPEIRAGDDDTLALALRSAVAA